MASVALDVRIRHVVTSGALAALWALFAYRHVNVFLQTGNWTYLVFCFSETLQAALFATRLPAVTASTRRLDWVVAITGTVLPFFLVPHAEGIDAHGGVVVVAGLLMQMTALGSLNRSFAIVAAKRRIRTSGLYRLVRHPIYASYILMFSGYVWGNASAWNLTLYFAFIACLLFRINSEERHLALDAEYRAYASTVRYRLVPFLY